MEIIRNHLSNYLLSFCFHLLAMWKYYHSDMDYQSSDSSNSNSDSNNAEANIGERTLTAESKMTERGERKFNF